MYIKHVHSMCKSNITIYNNVLFGFENNNEVIHQINYLLFISMSLIIHPKRLCIVHVD